MLRPRTDGPLAGAGTEADAGADAEADGMSFAGPVAAVAQSSDWASAVEVRQPGFGVVIANAAGLR